MSIFSLANILSLKQITDEQALVKVNIRHVSDYTDNTQNFRMISLTSKHICSHAFVQASVCVHVLLLQHLDLSWSANQVFGIVRETVLEIYDS